LVEADTSADQSAAQKQEDDAALAALREEEAKLNAAISSAQAEQQTIAEQKDKLEASIKQTSADLTNSRSAAVRALVLIGGHNLILPDFPRNQLLTLQQLRKRFKV